ncbi:uncharacterized protein CDAR_392071 [Caerostris darwini]|uniref:Uncharacterized protein n=1 Tax=Caerostris darwini TaxID=1538125 RepID=A0AAV4RYF4_9ARAC|nr:uncharacterized protein CDAR_392071 [Caerostris darwini]
MKSCQPKANSFLWVRFLAEDCLEFSCESFRILITVLETSNCFTRVVLSTENRNSTIVLQTDVGYTMRDIRYWWLEGPRSVGMSSDVELPQFKVIGHRQRSKEVPLTTGKIPQFLGAFTKEFAEKIPTVYVEHFECNHFGTFCGRLGKSELRQPKDWDRTYLFLLSQSLGCIYVH